MQEEKLFPIILPVRIEIIADGWVHASVETGSFAALDCLEYGLTEDQLFYVISPKSHL